MDISFLALPAWLILLSLCCFQIVALAHNLLTASFVILFNNSNTLVESYCFFSLE